MGQFSGMLDGKEEKPQTQQPQGIQPPATASKNPNWPRIHYAAKRLYGDCSVTSILQWLQNEGAEVAMQPDGSSYRIMPGSLAGQWEQVKVEMLNPLRDQIVVILGFAVRQWFAVRSDKLDGEIIIVAEKGARISDRLRKEHVTYAPEEFRGLWGLDAGEIKRISEAKRIFGGTVMDAKGEAENGGEAKGDGIQPAGAGTARPGVE